MSTLPYEKTYAVDQTRGIASATPIPSLNIASVISSETGPVEIIEVRNQSELIDNYCTGSVISATDNETIQFNGALLTKARVDIVRADTSALRVGKGSYGSTIYFNSDYGLLKNVTKFKLSEKDTKLDYLWVKVKDTENNEVIYYLGNEEKLEADLTTEDFGKALALTDDDYVEVTIKTFFELLLDKGVCLSITDTKAVFIPEVVSFSDNLYIKPTDNKPYNDISGSVNKLHANSEKYANLDASTCMKIGPYTYYNVNSTSVSKTELDNPIGLNYKDSAEMPVSVFLMLAMHDLINNNREVKPLGFSVRAKLGEDGTEVINDIDAIYDLIVKSEKSDKELIITDAVFTDKGPSVYYYKNNAPTITLINNNDVITYEVPALDSFYEVTHATDETNSSYFITKDNYLVIDDTCYYSGSEPRLNDVTTYIPVSKEDISVPDFIDKTYLLMLNTYTMGKAPNNTFVMNGSHKISTSDKIVKSGLEHIDQTECPDKFAIVCKFTSSQPLFSYSYKKLHDEFDSYELAYNFKNVSDKITFSFDGNALNSMGSSIYYSKYNEDPDYKNNYIQIVELTGTEALDYKVSGDFGNEILNNPVTEAAYTEAILKFLKTKDKQYQFVTDAGHCSVALAQACKQVADEKFAQYVPSIPATLKTVAEIKDHVSKLNLDDFRCQYLVPGHKSTYNGNFLSTVPASLSYMFARINAFQTVSGEFNPLFGVRKGSVTAPNLIKFFDDEEAQELADQNINVITKDMTGTYIRSNFTSQRENSYLSEDQNAYMTNIISQVCEQYNPEIIAELNDKPTRDSVVNTLTTRLTNRLLSGKNPTVANFKVICDESLNTLSVIEARQLIYQVWVQYTPSVAYVLAYVHVKRLGSF